MFSLWLLLLCLLSNVTTEKEYHDEKDLIGLTDKHKIIQISLELVKDANMKIREVADIKDTHAGFKAFDIGLIMGIIREKYRRMLETYREMRDKNNGRSLFIPNSIWLLRPLHYIIAMEHIHTLETDIEKLSHMVEENVDEEFNVDMRYTVTKKSKRTREENMDAMRNIAREQQLKSSNREQGLLRRLGVTGHTARPRFQQQWPVEGSWVLGTYGDLNTYGH